MENAEAAQRPWGGPGQMRKAVDDEKASTSTPRSVETCGRKTAQGWPRLPANFMAPIGIFSQSLGPSLAIWANPVQISFRGPSAQLSSF